MRKSFLLVFFMVSLFAQVARASEAGIQEVLDCYLSALSSKAGLQASEGILLSCLAKENLDPRDFPQDFFAGDQLPHEVLLPSGPHIDPIEVFSTEYSYL